MATIFSTGIIPLLMTFVIVQLYLISKKENLDTSQFEYHKDVLFYYNGINVLLTFVVSLLAGLLTTRIFLIFIVIYSILFLFGFKKIMEIKPIGSYFNDDQADIIQLHHRTQKQTTFVISFLVGVFFFLYFLISNQ